MSSETTYTIYNDEHFSELVKTSSNLIKKISSEFPPEKIGISFNGGKDSVLVMELLLLTLGVNFVSKCHTFVLDEPDEFEEVIQFREQYVKDRLPGTTLFHASASNGLCDGLWEVKNQLRIEAVFLGTRLSDPSGKYQKSPLAPTTTGWPPMLRACPLFYWNFEDVWKFILHHNVPRCALYEEGYSSLGAKALTSKNPNLQNPDGSFLPAWKLSACSWERCGRT